MILTPLFGGVVVVGGTISLDPTPRPQTAQIQESFETAQDWTSFHIGVLRKLFLILGYYNPSETANIHIVARIPSSVQFNFLETFKLRSTKT